MAALSGAAIAVLCTVIFLGTVFGVAVCLAIRVRRRREREIVEQRQRAQSADLRSNDFDDVNNISALTASPVKVKLPPSCVSGLTWRAFCYSFFFVE
jgi:hypothetical protein